MWTMRSARVRAGLLMLLGALAGCSTMNAYYNEPLPPVEVTPAAGPAQSGEVGLHPISADDPRCFQRARPWGPDVLAVTLSGGGSRAAVFGAAVLLELQDIGALDSVDLVSSVSGGSLAAALYALSRDPGEPDAGPDAQKRIIWRRATVIEMTSTNLLTPWILRWLRPDSIAKYWFTAYDRTDLFVDTLNSELLSGLGKDGGYPTFADLNPQRGTLILNATNFTEARSTDVFTFTPWDFKAVVNSDICNYEVARGVSASAAFPGVLQYSTLRDFRRSASAGDQEMPASYVDLMDGGATDNLGLKGLNQALEQLHLCGQGSAQPPAADPCRKLLVLIVDAQNGFEGRDPSEADPRGGLDRLFDTNFLDAYDTLMQTGYGQLLHAFRQDMEGHPAGQAEGAGVLNLPLLMLVNGRWLGYDGQYGTTTCPNGPSGPSAGPGTEQFALERACALAKSARDQVADVQPELGQKLRGISTNWRIDPDQVACLEVAAYALVAAARPELEKFLAGEKVLGPQDAARFAQNKSQCTGRPAASS
jgi:predicted acylesterase/phospholipase RssA